MGRGEPLLAEGADAGEEDLARIAIAILNWAGNRAGDGMADFACDGSIRRPS
jgi:hypothetical protein